MIDGEGDVIEPTFAQLTDDDLEDGHIVANRNQRLWQRDGVGL